MNSGMGERDWRPFVYGGLASCTAEFGKNRLKINKCIVINPSLSSCGYMFGKSDVP